MYLQYLVSTYVAATCLAVGWKPRGASTAGLHVVHFDTGTGTRTWLLNLNLVSGASCTTTRTAVL